MKRIVILLVAGALISLMFIESTQAIPAFARRYRLSCQTCHNPFPRLTAYGEDFAGNGFQLPDGPEPARSYADVGDEELDLMRNFPIAARLDLHGSYMPDSEQVDTDLRFIDRAKLLSGGAIAKDIAYYFYFYMSEEGEVAGVEDAYIHFNNIGGSEFDVMAGQFQISDPLFKRELRLTFEDYHIYKTEIGHSLVNMAYDRGIMMTYSAFEGNDLVLEIVNGNGIDAPEDRDSIDDDSFKNILFRASQSLGESGLRVGGVYYYARDTKFDHMITAGQIDDVTDEVTWWGIDASFDYKDTFSANFQFMMREDSDPYYTGEEVNLETTGGIAEVIFAPDDKDSKFYFVGLYNWIDSDDDIYDYESIVLNVTHMIRRNIKGFVEYGYDLEREENMATLGLVVAF